MKSNRKRFLKNSGFTNSQSVIRYAFLLFVLCIPLLKSNAQLLNLDQLLTNATGSNLSEIAELHSINNNGWILGSNPSRFEPEKTELFVLVPSSSGGYEFLEIGEYAGCELVDIDDQNRVLINATPVGSQRIEPYLIRDVYQPIAERILNQSAYPAKATKLIGDLASINTELSGLPDRSQSEENPYRGKPNTLTKMPKVATKGSFLQIESGNEIPGGFPIAFWYNLPTEIHDFAANGHSCGKSQGYTLGENMQEPFPFLATKDSVYQLLQGMRGTAIAMNDDDQVIGTWLHPLSGRAFGFYYEPGLGGGAGRDWLDLRLAIPKAINTDGIVVGHSQDTAFIMMEKAAISKQKLIPNLPSAWTVNRLYDINDRLEVIGEAHLKDDRILFKARLEIAD